MELHLTSCFFSRLSFQRLMVLRIGLFLCLILTVFHVFLTHRRQELANYNLSKHQLARKKMTGIFDFVAFSLNFFPSLLHVLSPLFQDSFNGRRKTHGFAFSMINKIRQTRKLNILPLGSLMFKLRLPNQKLL